MPTSSTARGGSSGRQARPGTNGHKPRPEASQAGTGKAGTGKHGADKHGADKHGADKHGADRAGMAVPGMPRIAMPGLTLPSGRTGTFLWWGGLAAVAALGVVDWPVAALIGAGTWVAERHARQAASAAVAG